MKEDIFSILFVIPIIPIIIGLVGQFYFQRRAMLLRKELWRREDARAAGTVPYADDGYEDWSLPIPTTPNTRLYAERKERPVPPIGLNHG